MYIPELGLTFEVKSSSRLFACQNPLYQGGGRKGLPKSFTNRFTQVYVDKLSESDLVHICFQLFPELSRGLLEKMVAFTFKVRMPCMLLTSCHHPFLLINVQVDELVRLDSNLWEFNLRDVLRWCSLMRKHEVTCLRM